MYKHSDESDKIATMSQKVHSKKDKQKFIEIFRNKNGHITKSCKAYGIHRSTYYEWIEEDWFKAEIDAVMEEEIDKAEAMAKILRDGIPEYQKDENGEIERDENGEPIISGWIEKPDAQMIKHFLETKGKKRGYGKQIGVDLNIHELPKNVSIGLKIHKKK